MNELVMQVMNLADAEKGFSFDWMPTNVEFDGL